MQYNSGQSETMKAGKLLQTTKNLMVRDQSETEGKHAHVIMVVCLPLTLPPLLLCPTSPGYISPHYIPKPCVSTCWSWIVSLQVWSDLTMGTPLKEAKTLRARWRATDGVKFNGGCGIFCLHNTLKTWSIYKWRLLRQLKVSSANIRESFEKF